MENRLARFLKLEELTAVKFAEIMEVQPSSISHLLSGRNKPNFEFISRMLLRFPRLNPDWIINGLGDVYKSEDVNNANKVTDVIEGNTSGIYKCKDSNCLNKVTDVTTSDSDVTSVDTQQEKQINTNSNYDATSKLGAVKFKVTDVTSDGISPNLTHVVNRKNDPPKVISRVILFYSDGSFEEYIN